MGIVRALRHDFIYIYKKFIFFCCSKTDICILSKLLFIIHIFLLENVCRVCKTVHFDIQDVNIEKYIHAAARCVYHKVAAYRH